MVDETPDPQPNTPHVVRNLGCVPVYNCHVYLSPPDPTGLITARGAALPEVQATGHSEREVLQHVVREFKAVISRYLGNGEAIPFLDPPLPAAPGERTRWLPVHL